MPAVPSTKPFYIGTNVLQGTSGSILFVDSNLKVAQDNANFSFNDTTNSLTVGGNITGSAFYGDGANLTNLPASTWYDGVEIPSAALGDDNDYYLQNTSGDYYKKESGVWNLVGNLRPPANSYQGNYLISGGQVVWVSGYIFSVSPAVYSIAGQIYSSPLTLVTLDAADLTYDRIDLIVLDDTGVADFVTGTASASPVEPDIDPGSQLKLSFVIVGAGTTEPGVAQTMIYQEDIEWTTSVSNATLNKVSTNNPRSGSKCIEGTTVLKNQYFQSVSPSSFDINSKDLFVFYVRSKAGWAGGAINIQWRLGTTLRGVTISLVDGFAGFDSTNTSTYQQIAIPTSAFNIAQGLLVDRVRFTISKAVGSIGFYFDDCWLQSGIVPSPGTSPGGIIWRGEWNSATAYSEQDAVSYNGTSYIAINSSVNLAPDVNTDEWNILAQGTEVIPITNDTTTNSTYYPLFSSATTGDLTNVYTTNSKLTWNPSTGTLGATTYTGALASTVTATTQSPGDNSTKVATTAFVTSALLTVDLTAYLTITEAENTYAPLASPALTGNPTAPTPAANDNDTSIATTAYVQTELSNVSIGTIGCNFNGNGTVPAAGSKFRLEVPYNCTINSVTLLGDLSGSAVVDIWVDTYANYEPSVADSICGSNKPTISASNKGQLTSFTSWTTTSITAGQILVFYLDSVSTITDLTIIIKVTKT